MVWLNRLQRRVRALRHKAALDRDMDEELRSHIEMEAEDLVRTRGLSPVEARRQAMLAFGGMERVREEGRDARGVRLLEESLADIRFAARMCSKHIGFAAATVLTLALGIGASTAVFSVVYGVLLKPLPFPSPDRLVSLLHRAPAVSLDQVNQGPATYFTYLDNQRAFEGIGAWDADEASITGRGEPEHVEVLNVSHATLPLLRVQPLVGRLFRAEDDAPGHPPRAVLTYGYWQGRFGGAADVVGQTLQVDGVAAEIIGVLPRSFRFLDRDPAVLLPMGLDRSQATGLEFGFQALARLKPGVTLAQANADVARMIPQLPQAFGAMQLQPNVRLLADDVVGSIGRTLWILLAAVGVVLLIACGNVANLFLIRGEGRQQELAMRTALGAGRSRIARVLLSESVLLAVAGGGLGLVLAQAALDVLRTIAPANLPRVEEIGIDPTVLFFTLSISLVSGALFGLLVVVRFGSPGVTALREGSRSASDAPRRHRTRNVLVVGQIALALMLMIASGLMIRTVVAMRQVQPGFAGPARVQTFRLTIPESLIGDATQVARTEQGVAERLAQVPGVTSVGISSSITMDGEDNGNPLEVEEFPVTPGSLPPLRRFKSFAPGYFETMGNPLVAGRSITWAEVYQRQPVAVVSEVLAREYWQEPGRALGRRIRSPGARWYQIVGVAGDERDDGLNRPPTPIVYWPLLNDSYERRTMAYTVRSDRVGAPGFVSELRQAVWSVNPNLPLAEVQTLTEVQARSMAQTSFAMVMLAIAAGVALLLGIVGVYGVVAYMAAQRTREIGIRMALGARVGDVRRMFLGHGLRLTVTGIAIGLGAALGLTRVMSALLFGVGPADRLSYIVVSVVLGSVALLATSLAARRATRVDPLIAMRADA
ncbi:MAG TPA: ABC transporter permease [Gemmatimonadales bacterium]|nr:ABC transporter permease [Gemmatimonadales bacterium]